MRLAVRISEVMSCCPFEVQNLLAKTLVPTHYSPFFCSIVWHVVKYRNYKNNKQFIILVCFYRMISSYRSCFCSLVFHFGSQTKYRVKAESNTALGRCGCQALSVLVSKLRCSAFPGLHQQAAMHSPLLRSVFDQVYCLHL